MLNLSFFNSCLNLDFFPDVLLKIFFPIKLSIFFASNKTNYFSQTIIFFVSTERLFENLVVKDYPSPVELRTEVHSSKL